MQQGRDTAERKRSSFWLLRLGLFAIIVGVAVIAFLFGIPPELSSEAIKATILDWGLWGAIASIALMVLHSFVPFPAELVAVANGMIYGPVWGTMITWTGAMLGALVAFGLARGLGRPAVARLLAQRDWKAVDDWAASEGGRVILLARLIPAIAFNLINYAAGLSRISWWTFAWTTGIGILPLTVLMVVVGDRIRALPWWIWAVLLAAAAGIWFLLRGKVHPVRARQDGGRPR